MTKSKVRLQNNNFINKNSEFKIKYEKKLIRRSIIEDFFSLKMAWDCPFEPTLLNFLFKYKYHLLLVREAFSSYKNSKDLWFQEIWNILKLDNQKILELINLNHNIISPIQLSKLEEFLLKNKQNPIQVEIKKNNEISSENVKVKKLIENSFPNIDFTIENIKISKNDHGVITVKILQTRFEINCKIKFITDEQVTGKSFFVGNQNPEICEPTVFSKKMEDNERLKILNLPPLVKNDLTNSSVDLNVLQHLFKNAEHLRHLRGVRLEDFTESDIRSLSYGINKEVGKLKNERKVGLRPIAQILLSVARLQYDRLETGTNSSSIRYCLGMYSIRMGQYLIQQHNRFDAAIDYFNEAIFINRIADRGVDFPIALLLKSFFGLKNHINFKNPIDCVNALDQSIDDDEVISSAARGFVYLSSNELSLGQSWFEKCSLNVQRKVLNYFYQWLSIDKGFNFVKCVNAYKEAINKLELLFKQSQKLPSLHIIGQLGIELNDWFSNYKNVLGPTNKEIVSLLIHSSEYVEQALNSDTYEAERDRLREVKIALERVLSFKNDNRTSLWASIFNSTSLVWSEVVEERFKEIALENSPSISVKLSKDRVYLTNEEFGPEKPRISFEIINSGKGVADRLNIQFMSNKGDIFYPKKIHNFKMMPNSKIEDYIEVTGQDSKEDLNLTFEIDYYDPERRFTNINSSHAQLLPFYVKGISTNKITIPNPFQTSREVEDENMFVGRDQILNEVCSDIIDSNMGGLLMLHGQRRVGKSSLLLFLEKRLEEVSIEEHILPVKVTWLNYSAHSAPLVLEEISKEIKHNCKKLFNLDIVIPPRQEFRESYSVAFNDVINSLEINGINRTAIIIDEFDVVVSQLEDPLKGFNRPFFEYLRGLSKRKNVSLVLTGGEMMPMLFERWGEVFNHDRTWRIEYLSQHDDSVNKLIRNPYVKDIIEIKDSAIDLIKEISACNPFFIQMICHNLIRFAQQQRTRVITTLDVEEVSQWLIQKEIEVKHVRHLYAPLTNSVDSLDLAIVGIISKKNKELKYVSVEEVVNSINFTSADVINKIGELTRREILERHPVERERIRIKLPLFSDWFNENKPEFAMWASFVKE